MSTVNDSDIETLLDRWAQTKEEIAELEKRLEKYKKLATRIMSSKKSNLLTSSSYTLSRKDITRTTLSKKDVPEQVWEKYAQTCTYPAYYLNKKK
jgi:hypothetical protein